MIRCALLLFVLLALLQFSESVQLGKRKSIFPKDFETLSTDLKEVEHAAKNAVELLVKRTNVNYEIVTVHKAHSRLHKGMQYLLDIELRNPVTNQNERLRVTVTSKGDEFILDRFMKV